MVLSKAEQKAQAYRLSTLVTEPKCPECKSGVLRNKCFYELGGDCPRHALVGEYGGSDAIRYHLEDISPDVRFMKVFVKTDTPVSMTFFIKIQIHRLNSHAEPNPTIYCEIYNKFRIHAGHPLMEFVKNNLSHLENSLWEATKLVHGVFILKYNDTNAFEDYAKLFVATLLGRESFEVLPSKRPTRSEMA